MSIRDRFRRWRLLRKTAANPAMPPEIQERMKKKLADPENALASLQVREMTITDDLTSALAKLPKEYRDAATIRIGTMLVIGQLQYEMLRNGGVVVNASSNLVQTLAALDGSQGSAQLRTQHLATIAMALCTAAGLIRASVTDDDPENCNPKKFAEFIGEMIDERHEDEWTTVCNAWRAHKSAEKAQELEELFKLEHPDEKKGD